MTFKLGLTGSIGMGKSTTAVMFADLGCAVWDADAAVHRLYSVEGAAVAPIAAAFPGAVVDGAVARDRLRAILATDSSALSRLEEIVHPLVARDRMAFVAANPGRILVFDIPLLFETGGDAEMDVTVCVHVASDRQRARVLARGIMGDADLERILARQMPIADKLARADYTVETDSLDHARAQVEDIVQQIKG